MSTHQQILQNKEYSNLISQEYFDCNLRTKIFLGMQFPWIKDHTYFHFRQFSDKANS